MTERRTLTEALAATPKIDPAVERAFLQGKAIPTRGDSSSETATYSAPPPTTTAKVLNRVSFSTKLRKDYVDALKRASLERQLNGVEPSTIVDMLEQAVEPWLRANGYVQ